MLGEEHLIEIGAFRETTDLCSLDSKSQRLLTDTPVLCVIRSGILRWGDSHIDTSIEGCIHRIVQRENSLIIRRGDFSMHTNPLSSVCLELRYGIPL